MEERKLREREFSNRRHSEGQGCEDNKKYYSVTRKSTDFVNNWMQVNCPGKKVLDYCCGLGATSFRIIQYGASEVVGIDISDNAIAYCRNEAKKNGFEKKSSFYVMDAENMKFNDSTFDLIFCMGVLHHLDLQNAYRELIRVLKPNGKILCLEALMHNPFIQLYRKLTPKLRTAWEVKHILTVDKIKQAEMYFGNMGIYFFHLSVLLAVPLRKTVLFNPSLSFLEKVDDIILKIPGIRKNAWMALFILDSPKGK